MGKLNLIFFLASLLFATPHVCKADGTEPRRQVGFYSTKKLETDIDACLEVDRLEHKTTNSRWQSLVRCGCYADLTRFAGGLNLRAKKTRGDCDKLALTVAELPKSETKPSRDDLIFPEIYWPGARLYQILKDCKAKGKVLKDPDLYCYCATEEIDTVRLQFPPKQIPDFITNKHRRCFNMVEAGIPFPILENEIDQFVWDIQIAKERRSAKLSVNLRNNGNFVVQAVKGTVILKDKFNEILGHKQVSHQSALPLDGSVKVSITIESEKIDGLPKEALKASLVVTDYVNEKGEAIRDELAIALLRETLGK